MGGGGPPSSSPSFRRGTRRRDRRHRHHLRRGQRVPSQSFSDDFLMDDEGGPNQVYRAPHSPSEIVGIIAALDPQVVEVMSHICMEKKLGVKVEREGEES